MTQDPPAIDPNVPDIDDGKPIECRVGSWYYKRMGLMFLMLFAMGCWFWYDAAIGYPAKKEIWDRYTEMTGYDLRLISEMSGPEQLPDSGIHVAVIGQSQENDYYRVFDASGEIKVDSAGAPENAKKAALKKLQEVVEEKRALGTLAADDKQEVLGALSQVLNMNLKGKQSDSARLDEWRTVAKDEGWELEPEEYTDAKIATQWQFTYGMFAASLLVVVVFLLNRGKVLKADSDALYPPGGARVAFADVFRIDRRKWDHKGLAYAKYRDGGTGKPKKATIDDLKFVGADKILNRLLNNFEGELIDRVPDEDEPEVAPQDNDDVLDGKEVTKVGSGSPPGAGQAS